MERAARENPCEQIFALPGADFLEIGPDEGKIKTQISVAQKILDVAALFARQFFGL
jgi:hypothetical protein